MVTSDKKRYFFIDIVKVISLFAMSIIHSDSVFSGYSENGFVAYMINHDLMSYISSILYLFAPGIFMICMGFVMKGSSNDSPEKFAKRGLKLLLSGFLLNVFRGFTVNALGAILLQDKQLLIDGILWLIGSDILFFAGLYFLAYSLLLKLKLSDLTIFIIAIALQIIGTLLPPILTSNQYMNLIVGNFVYANEMSFFPFVWWMIFPFMGYLYRKGFDNSNNKNNYMYKCIIGSIVVFLITALSINALGGNVKEYLLWGQHELIMKTPSMLLTISLEIAYISIFYIVFENIKLNKIKEFISSISIRINTIYCIHWILLMNIMTIISLFTVIHVTNIYQVIITGIIVMIVSILISFKIKKV